MFGSGWNSSIPSRSHKRGSRTRLAMETLESRDVPAGTLGTSTLLEGPAASSASVILTTTDASWTAASNASWLHATTTSGTGNALVDFTVDANTGATRTGTLTIDGATLTVTQAGSNYSAANPLTTIASTGLNLPQGIAVDSSGNVYIADTNNNAIKEYNASTQTVNTLNITGLNHPYGVAVDSSGNIYIADTSNNAVKEYNATGTLINTIVQSVQTPTGVAVDGAGNVYVVDQASNSVTEYNASGTLIATLPFTGLSQPTGVAVDASGNVYVADTGNNRVEEYNGQAVTTLSITGLSLPTGVAVDGSGNVYITDYYNSEVKEYVAATGAVNTLASGLNLPTGVAVDGSGNVYFSNAGANTVQELVRAYVPTSPVTLPNTAGSSQLAVVLPSTESLTGTFAPTSDQSWLTITGVSNGVVSYSYTANTGTTALTAHITVLGQSITVTQAAPPVTPPVTSISGVVFLDYNDNGVQDSGDTGVAGETVFLDLHGDGTLDAGDPNTVTDANGNYTLNLLGVPAGSYTVEVQLTAVQQATGSPLMVTLPGAVPTSASLGIRPTSTIFPINAGPELSNGSSSSTSASASSSADIVQSLYVAYFGRPADASTTSSLLAAFGSSGTSSSSGSSVASNFLASSGSSNFLALATDLSMSPEFLKYQVDSLYLTYLGRLADAGGEANFISALQHGMDQRQVVIQLVTSAEYTSEHADNSDYVQSLFEKILGRAASASELSMYVQSLQNGTSRAAVAQGILYSAEASELTVEAFYAQFLQRKADPTGLAAFTSLLENGMDPSKVAVELLVSTEFLNNATSSGVASTIT